MKSPVFILAVLAAAATSGCIQPKQDAPAGEAGNAPNKFGYRGSVTDPSGVIGKPSAAPDGAVAQALAPATPSGTIQQGLTPTPPAGSTGGTVTQPILPTVNTAPPRPPDTGVNPQQQVVGTTPPPPPPSVGSTGATGNTGATPSTGTTTKPKDDYPFGIPVPGKDGMVYSPYDKEAGYVDVRGMKPGALVEDPYSKKYFRVP